MYLFNGFSQTFFYSADIQGFVDPAVGFSICGNKLRRLFLQIIIVLKVRE
jgi:hypothetical protein